MSLQPTLYFRSYKTSHMQNIERYLPWSIRIIIAGLFFVNSTAFGYELAMIGVVMFGLGTLFSFVTLPVEYDASNRALAWLERKNMVSQQELVGAKDALKWAARTYVVAAIGSLATLIYLLLRVNSSNRN